MGGRHFGWFLMAMLGASATPAQACQQLPTIYFRNGSAAPDEAGLAQLRGFAEQALRNLRAIDRIQAIGHSDRTGSTPARHRIALRRAEAVRDVLISYGIPAAMIGASGLADRQPWTDTEENIREPQNRRVELRVSLTSEEIGAAEARRRAAMESGARMPIC